MTTTHTLDSLKILDLGSNALAALDAVAAALPYLCGPHARLMQLNLKGNPVAEAQGYQETVVRVCGAALKVLDSVRFDAKFLERREKRREEAEASTGVVAKADEALEVSSVGKKRKSGVEEEVVLVKKAKSINGVAVKKVKKTVEPSRDGKESKVVATKGTFEKLATTVRLSNTLEPSSSKKSISTQRQRDVSNPLIDKAASKWTAKPASHTTKSLAVPKLDTPPAKKPADAFFVGSFQPTPTPTKKASGFLSSNQASIAVNASAAREDQRLEEARSGVVAVIDGQGRSGKGLVKTAASGKRVIKALEVEELEKVVEAGTTPGTGLAPAWD
ncbi:hypothetical protein BC830DRAFT_1084624 [Chytriomyces sp. MP71]|nr:hypothetical protein BC830DRAFT_1084624 [Chytriomyces sp. MP71]